MSAKAPDVCLTCPFWRELWESQSREMEVSGDGREGFSDRKNFAEAVDRNHQASRMMDSLEGTDLFGEMPIGISAAGDFYSIFDNSVVTSEFFCQHKTVLSWGRILFTKGAKTWQTKLRSFEWLLTRPDSFLREAVRSAMLTKIEGFDPGSE